MAANQNAMNTEFLRTFSMAYTYRSFYLKLYACRNSHWMFIALKPYESLDCGYLRAIDSIDTLSKVNILICCGFESLAFFNLKRKKRFCIFFHSFYYFSEVLTIYLIESMRKVNKISKHNSPCKSDWNILLSKCAQSDC